MPILKNDNINDIIEGEKMMIFEGKKRRIMSMALLVTMLGSVLPQQNVFAVQQGGYGTKIPELHIQLYYGQWGFLQNGIPTLVENPDAAMQEEGAESEQEAGSESVAENNSQGEASDVSSTASGSTSRQTNYSSDYEYDYSNDTSNNSSQAQLLTNENHTSTFLSLDKSAIGFTKIGDKVTVTATLAEGVNDTVEWAVRDSSMLTISPVSSTANTSTVDVIWENGTGETSFYAKLKSNPEEYVEGTAMFFDSSASLSEENGEADTLNSENTNSELKTDFESPEVEAFLRELFIASEKSFTTLLSSCSFVKAGLRSI